VLSSQPESFAGRGGVDEMESSSSGGGGGEV